MQSVIIRFNFKRPQLIHVCVCTENKLIFYKYSLYFLPISFGSKFVHLSVNVKDY